jgi:transposase InsO family protein
MNKAHLIITAINVQGISYRQAAHQFGVSKSWVHKIHRRWLEEGDAAFLPRSTRPHRVPHTTSPEIQSRVLDLRSTLENQGLDAGADTLQALLAREGVSLGRTTIWRILKRNDAITPQPQKKPRSAWTRFEADQPNQTWQSDVTHWRLANGREMEIIGWLDDHSRFFLHLSAHYRVKGQTVTDTFTQAAQEHGYPASTLTDNGNVYTTKHAGGARGHGSPNAFETLLQLEGILQKNGRPYKPTTQGKIERSWKTLKQWLAAQPRPDTLPELQHQLDCFTQHYNTQRPHRAINRQTPHQAYYLIPKAQPTGPHDPELWRVRYDIVNQGRISLRWGNKMLHLGVGREHNKTEVIALVHGLTATVITTRGEVLGEYNINPEKGYQAKK